MVKKHWLRPISKSIKIKLLTRALNLALKKTIIMKMRSLAVLLFASFSFFMNAQDFAYNFSAITGNYENLANPTIVTSDVWDDPNITINIGFEFELYDSTYTFLTISEYIGTGTGGSVVFGDGLGIVNVLIPYGSDIIDRGFDSGESQSYIAHEVVGTEGSRIFKLEWNNVGFYSEVDGQGTANNFTNFQMWLYEGSNNIEVHFGPTSIKQFNLVHDAGGVLVGLLPNFDLSDYPEVLWSLGGDAADPDVVPTTDFEYTYPAVLENDPIDGTIYRFSTFPVAVFELPNLAAEVQIYPTLIDHSLTINTNQTADEQLDLTIIDIMGRTVLQKENIANNFTINTAFLLAGNYFVKVSGKSGIYTQKIIKQ